MRGARKEGEPLDLGHRRIVGSGTLSPIMHLGVRRLSGATFDIISREVLRFVWMRGRAIRWDPRGRQMDTRCLEIGVDTPLNSHISGVHGIGE
jgi:hypothetical protein